LFTVASGSLVNHSSKDISDVTIAFLDLENVDFDILYAILMTFRSNFIRHCVGDGHLKFCGCKNFA